MRARARFPFGKNTPSYVSGGVYHSPTWVQNRVDKRALPFASHGRSKGQFGRVRQVEAGHIPRENDQSTARELNMKGQTKHPLYATWLGMRDRCQREKCQHYGRYGALGVTVCERWDKSFEAFVEDVGERPPGKTLDRFPDPSGNYEPGNVRWATAAEQRANRRKVKRVSPYRNRSFRDSNRKMDIPLPEGDKWVRSPS
jgi:hypothetical protein